MTRTMTQVFETLEKDEHNAEVNAWFYLKSNRIFLVQNWNETDRERDRNEQKKRKKTI